MTQGFCALDFLSELLALSSAPSFSLLAAASSSSSLGSRKTKTRRLLSGDHGESLDLLCGVGQALRFAA